MRKVVADIHFFLRDVTKLNVKGNYYECFEIIIPLQLSEL